jgi:hypothetical protein
MPIFGVPPWLLAWGVPEASRNSQPGTASVILPTEAASLLAVLTPVFTQPTAARFTTLLAGTLLTTGRRTVANILRTLRHLAPGHRTTYQRLLSRAPWSTLELGCALAAFILRHLIPTGPVTLVGDDTVDGHKGKHVYGKARHRDPVRSTHSFTAWRYGHKWVVLAILVKFPFANRRWALPILVDLYRTPELNKHEKRPHRTPAQLMCRLLRLLLIRFPERTFIFVGDAGYGTHQLARFCHRHRNRLTLISKFHPDANLFDRPKPHRGKGRPPIKGRRRRKPRQAVAKTKRKPLTVDWYGGGTRQVGVVTQSAHWYKSGQGLVPVRWVFVADRTGTHRDEYFFATDPSLSASVIIGLYCGRWNIETTFQELRSCLGLESTRGWCKQTVLRAAPCLFGLYSVVALLYHRLPKSKRCGCVAWAGKNSVSFSDAWTVVRRWLWAEGVFQQTNTQAALQKIPKRLRELLLNSLVPAP